MLKIIIAPLVGGVIGYITNDLAIKMLFRPRRAVYIGKFHIPFTPGLIPQQKKRIAASIGRVISNQLLNADTLRETMLSPETLDQIRAGLTGVAESFADDPRTVREILNGWAGEERIAEYEESLTRGAASFISDKLVQHHVGSSLVDIGLRMLRNSLPDSLGGASAILDEWISGPIRTAFGDKLDEVIRASGPEFLEREIGHISDAALDKPACEIYAENRDKLPGAVDKIAALYESVLAGHMDKVLAAVDIEQIVVKKISSFKAEQLEQMIFGIMKRELKAIVYLGAALGFLMGFVNLLF